MTQHKITTGGAPEGYDAQLILKEIAKSDGPNALTFEMLDELMGSLLRIRKAAENP